MAYPKKPKLDSPTAEIQPIAPATPTVAPPSVPQMSRPQGGAPVISTEMKLPKLPALPTAQRPQTTQPRPFYERMPGFDPPTPTRRVIVPPSPWKPEDVEKAYGPLMKGFADKLWEIYQKLPASARNSPFWEKVGQNVQEVARIAITRTAINRAGVEPAKLDENEQREIRTSGTWQWYHSRPGRR